MVFFILKSKDVADNMEAQAGACHRGRVTIQGLH